METMKTLTINGRRQFRYNGRKFYVTDLLKADRTDGRKYYVQEVGEDGRFHIMYNALGCEIEKFATIKDAQRFVRNWDFLMRRWEDL